MSRKQKDEPNQGMTRACASLQEPGGLVRLYKRDLKAKFGDRNSENQSSDYSSPVCYAHLREFREGF